MKLVIATKNINKVREIRDKFSDIQSLEIMSINDFPGVPDVIEDGETFEENSRKKALTVSRQITLPVMADDSGLVVDSLGGRPGVYSARYGGSGITDADRYMLLIREMRDVPVHERTARFVCVISIVLPDGRTFEARGECEGMIIDTPRGDHGFGYDPVFLVPSLNKTMAELTTYEKNRISHRALALEKTRDIINSITS